MPRISANTCTNREMFTADTITTSAPLYINTNITPNYTTENTTPTYTYTNNTTSTYTYTNTTPNTTTEGVTGEARGIRPLHWDELFSYEENPFRVSNEIALDNSGDEHMFSIENWNEGEKALMSYFDYCSKKGKNVVVYWSSEEGGISAFKNAVYRFTKRQYIGDLIEKIDKVELRGGIAKVFLKNGAIMGIIRCDGNIMEEDNWASHLLYDSYRSSGIENAILAGVWYAKGRFEKLREKIEGLIERMG